MSFLGSLARRCRHFFFDGWLMIVLIIYSSSDDRAQHRKPLDADLLQEKIRALQESAKTLILLWPDLEASGHELSLLQIQDIGTLKEQIPGVQLHATLSQGLLSHQHTSSARIPLSISHVACLPLTQFALSATSPRAFGPSPI